MLKDRTFVVLWAVLLCSLPALAQEPLDSQRLFSSSVAERFYEVGYELANSPDLTRAEAEQAIVLLTAALNLDSRAGHVYPVLIKLAIRSDFSPESPTALPAEQDYSQLVYYLLSRYVHESADMKPIREGVEYLLGQLDSREEREKLLGEMLRDMSGKNQILDSELAMLLGQMCEEKTDKQSALVYFVQAFNNNNYNKLAFAKVAELAPQELQPATVLGHLRLVLEENPTDIESATSFALYAEQLQLYDTAADAYSYCVDLFRFLHPSEPLPASLYLPWAICNYNTKRNQQKCMQIADEFRQAGDFDLFLEAIAGKAAAKIGDEQQAKQILNEAEAQALELISFEPKTIAAEQMAWFYCFALPDANKAVDWANRAYSAEPNSATAASLLAYALVADGEPNWAKTLIDNYESSQIAELALAQIQLAQGQQNSAIETLKSAIERDPGSPAAERAKELLVRNGTQYTPPNDPDFIAAQLRDSLGTTMVPKFVRPGEMISARLNLHGDKFAYASNFGGTLAIINSHTGPLVISDDGLLQGNIRVDVAVSGDLDEQIPQLVSTKIRPGQPIGPGQSLSVPLRLATGRLREILLTYPQASLDIEFTVYIDPVTTDQGVTNRLAYLEPIKVEVKRSGVELTSKYLRNRLNSLTKGRKGQKINTARLFTGLLMEHSAMADSKPLYKYKSADWLPTMLKSALAHHLAEDDWMAKVHAMAGLLDLPLDYELTNAAAKNLNETHWPARIMAIYLLATKDGQSFRKVLDWTAKQDSNELVRNMAIALGGAQPQDAEPTTSLTSTALEKPSPIGEPK